MIKNYFLILISFIFTLHSVKINSQTLTATFNYTGSVQTWTVPACVYCLVVDVRGAQGGGILANPYAGSGQGGRGARVQHNCIAVTPGQVLEIRVGECPTGFTGGYNGGGNGHNSSPVQMQSKGGGGATDIRIAPYAIGNRIVVAAGGGGRSGGSQQTNFQASGGNGGCATGVTGAGSPFTGTGGGGASQTAGGTGGPPWGGGQWGTAGSIGQGGNGGFFPTAAGGGGGGGLYGGGGGGGDNCCTGANGGGAGGGGSSLTPAAGTCTLGFQSGHGQVVITYTGGGNMITVSNTGPYCAGNTIQLNASVGATSYAWTGPNGFTSNLQNPTIPNSTALDAGTYTLNFTTPNCNGSTTTTVVVNTPINPTFNPITPICHNGAVPGLPAGSTNNPTITGTWTPSVISSAVPGTQQYLFTPASTFCANTATINVTILPNEIPTFTQINPFCINDVPTALPNPSTNPTPYTGTWSPSNIMTSAAGVFTYTFTPTAGQCAVPTTMDIAVLNYTTPTFQQIGPLCQYTVGVNLPVSSTNIVPIIGSWLPGLINTQVPNTTVYTFTPNPFQCASSTTMTIVIDPLNIPQFSQIPQVCEGDIPPVFPLISNNAPGITGSWNPPTIDSSVPGTVTYFFTPDPNQCSDSITMDVTVVPSLPPSFVADTLSGCNPLLVELSTVAVPGASYEWNWNGNPIGTGSLLSYLFTSAGCHDITLEYNLLGCLESTTYSSYICMENIPMASFTANPNVLSSTSETINFNNTSIGAISYVWDYGDGFTSTEFEESHFYNGITENILVTLSASTALGCTDVFELTLPVISDPIYYVPNTFTPDEDEYNQTWYPVFTTGFDPYNFQLWIYNRWGEVVWESQNADAGWDGSYGSDGTAVQSGVYTWKIIYANKETDAKKVVTGTVLVLR